MMDPRAIADVLIEAERTRTPVAAFTRTHFFLDADTAYKAQALFVDHRLQAGEHLIGAKLGLTSRVKRAALGIHEPLFGRLSSGMLLPAGEPVPLDQLIHPRAEPEIAFLLGKRLDGPVTPAGVLAATDAVVAAVEVMDSRYSGQFRLPDSIADNAGAARVDPTAAVAWLTSTLAARGEHLPAGSVVLSGGLTASVALDPGANVVAEFDGLGSVEVHS